jgi:hypothetical protein
MRKLLNATRRSIVSAFTVSIVVCLPAFSSDFQSGEAYIKSIQGTATYSLDHSTWSVLKPGMTLQKGDALRTGPDSTADLEFKYSGTALRVKPNSSLELAKLDEMVAGEDVIIDTRLNLESGSVIGSQDKLPPPSTFTIITRNGSVIIKGTEYSVAANGAVACFRGEVAVNSSQHGSVVSTEVPAGFSFNPAKGQVVVTSPSDLSKFNPDLQKVRDYSHGLTIDRGNRCKEPYPPVSPVHGHHGYHGYHGFGPPGKEHDHDYGHGDDWGDVYGS